MSKADMQGLDQVVKQLVTAELKEVRIEISNISQTLDELRHFLYQQYVKRESEQVALMHVLERIQQNLEAAGVPKLKTPKGESQRKKVARAK